MADHVVTLSDADETVLAYFLPQPALVTLLLSQAVDGQIREMRRRYNELTDYALLQAVKADPTLLANAQAAVTAATAAAAAPAVPAVPAAPSPPSGG